MAFQRIMVIGSAGAGKSTLARKLRDITGLPLHYLDLLNHRADRTTVSREEFDDELEVILRTEAWIIDGNYQRTIERRLQACDTVILLDYPLQLCLAGAAERVGRPREEMPWVEQTLDESFRQAILEFPNSKLPQIYALLRQYGEGRQVVILHSREEADAWMEWLASHSGLQNSSRCDIM